MATTIIDIVELCPNCREREHIEMVKIMDVKVNFRIHEITWCPVCGTLQINNWDGPNFDVTTRTPSEVQLRQNPHHKEDV